jgi:hypothetical protein
MYGCDKKDPERSSVEYIERKARKLSEHIAGYFFPQDSGGDWI